MSKVTPMREIETPLLSTSKYRQEETVEYHRSSEIRYVYFTSLEKFMFVLCSILVILLFLFVGLFARINQLEDNPPSLPIPTIPKHNTTCNPDQCQSSNCHKLATDILKDVDLLLDPCDDFYAYACKNWQANHSIPEYHSRIDIQTISQEAIHDRLHKILTSTLLPTPRIDRHLFLKISDLYNSCLDTTHIKTIGLEPLKHQFRIIQELIPSRQYKLTTRQLMKALVYLSEQDIWPLFELKIDYFDSKPMLSLWPGQIGLPNATMYADTSLRSVYFHAISTTIRAMFHSCNGCCSEFGEFSEPLFATRKIIEIERQLSWSGQFEWEKWSIERLQMELPMIQWSQLTQQQDYIMIPSVQWIKDLKRNLVTQPRYVQMYLIWRTAWKYVNVLDEPYRAPKVELDAYLGIHQPTRRLDICLELIDQHSTGLLLARYYVTHYQQHIALARQQLTNLTTSMIESIKHRVNNLEWIEDSVQKQQVINKLDKIEFQIGYSTSEPNIESPKSLMTYFEDIEIYRDDFFGNMRRTYQHESKQKWKLLEKSIVEHQQSWKVNAQSIQISYDQALNKVMIPSGLFQLPFYDPKGPTYLYIGTIGWMIGHEIMHGFDSIGIRYSDISQELFQEKNECLIRQYEKYGVDGKSSLDNNFADQGGIVFIELLKHKDNMSSLPQLENQWTNEQLSYIQFARLKCSKSTTQPKHYAPDHLRVNIPLVNSNRFSKVFNCKPGSYMNPDTICPIWYNI